MPNSVHAIVPIARRPSVADHARRLPDCDRVRECNAQKCRRFLDDTTGCMIGFVIFGSEERRFEKGNYFVENGQVTGDIDVERT